MLAIVAFARHCGIIDFPQLRCREGGAVPPNWRRLPLFPDVFAGAARAFLAWCREVVELTLAALEELITPGVTDIFIGESTGLRVVDADGPRQVSGPLPAHAVRALAVELMDAGGRHIDDALPCVDVALASGARVHAVLAPVSTRGTEISIRVPRAVTPGFDEWVSSGRMSPRVAETLRVCVAQRSTFLVTGAAGAGKTTLLASAMQCVGGAERILTIEDVAELRIDHPGVVSLETRQANSDGRGELGLRELIRQALRMRPDRIVLGECRGVEVLDALLAFSTGHDGGGTTLHARSLEEVPARLLALVSLAGLSDAAAVNLVLSAIDVVAHIEGKRAQAQVMLGRLKRSPQGVLVVEELGRGGV